MVDDDNWRDPTYGRIDRDIQDAVEEMHPKSLAQRVALENTVQEQRNRRKPGAETRDGQ